MPDTPPTAAPPHQPIHAPGPHLLTHVGLSCRGRVTRGPLGRMKAGYGGRRPRKPLVAGLNLTPLIDVMMVMVCFLLLNFKAEGQTCGCPRGVKLPQACNAGALSRAPVITVTPPSVHDPDGVVTLDGSEVSSLAELISDDSPDWKIAKLAEQLEVKKHYWRMTNPDQTFPGQVIVEADREVAFKALKKIVYSVGLAGYHELHFAVERPDPERTGWP